MLRNAFLAVISVDVFPAILNHFFRVFDTRAFDHEIPFFALKTIIEVIINQTVLDRHFNATFIVPSG